jgi:hypothetical protein
MMHRPHRAPSSWGDLARTLADVETPRGYIALSLPTTDSDCDGFVGAVDDFFAARDALIRSAIT